MHPNELKNRAVVAAVQAELDGFPATAEALFILADACAVEARALQFSLEQLPEVPWTVADLATMQRPSAIYS